MGLAAYGTPVYLDRMNELLIWHEGGYSLNPDYFDWREEYRLSRNFHDTFGVARSKDDPIDQRHCDLAASLQRFFEHVVMELTDFLLKVSGCKRWPPKSGQDVKLVLTKRRTWTYGESDTQALHG